MSANLTPAISRRALIAAVAAAPIIAIPAARAEQSEQLGADRSIWTARLAEWREAERAADEFYRDHMDAVLEAQPPNPLWKPYRSGTSITTGEPLWAEFRNSDFDEPDGGYLRGTRVYAQAEADYRAWRQQFEEFKAATDYDAKCARDDALGKAEGDAFDRLVRTPAPDTAALLEKLSILILEEGEMRRECPDVLLLLRADAERLRFAK